MNLWKRIRKLSLAQLLKLAWLFLKKPLLILPTWRATKDTFVICNRLYGTAHHKNNRANAFRHALWNVLISKNSLKWLKKEQKSIFWAQKVTDLYEKVTKNHFLEQQMDLHNNQVGRVLAWGLFDKNEEECVDLIQKKLETARKLTIIEEIEHFKNELIYISE